MLFTRHLRETKGSQAVKKLLPFSEETTYRAFHAITIKEEELWLSIQASAGHYCTPRKTLKKLSEYTTMEFALLNNQREFVRVSDILPGFTKLEEIEEHYDTVYSYVPVDLIDKLYKELLKWAK